MKFKKGDGVRVVVENPILEIGSFGNVCDVNQKTGNVKVWSGNRIVELAPEWISTVIPTCCISASEAEQWLREGMTFKSACDSIGAHDPVNHPKHYTGHPSGIECIQITEHMGFCLGNAMKYIWRADLKNDAIEDLKKAVWYINREIEKRNKK